MPGKSKRITIQAEKLLDALGGSKNLWLTRREVAFKIGKKRLTPYDIELLELLAEQGHIAVAQEEGYSRDGYRWLYGVFDGAPPPP